MTKETFFGDSYELTLTADHTLDVRLRRAIAIVSTDAAWSLTLPDARRCKAGGPRKAFFHHGDHDVTLKDNTGATLGTITPGDAILLYLVDRSTLAGTWIWRLFPRDFAKPGAAAGTASAPQPGLAT